MPDIQVPHKVKRPTSVTVGEFFEGNREPLKMKLLNSDKGFSRKISEPSVNRPGLALSGFFSYFAYKRVQVVGNSEVSYLHSIEPHVAVARFTQLCSWEIPCLVVAREKKLQQNLLDVADAAGISVFQSAMITMKYLNAATIRLDWAFAATTTMHGCLVDVQGVGVLIMGPSGSGKSESLLGLLERGASLVADDMVQFRLIEDREIQGMAPELGRNMIEVRGIGVLNVAAIFGVGSVRLSKRLDLVIQLVPNANLNDLERFDTSAHTADIMGKPIQLLRVPVVPGRDIAGLIEIAALNHKLKSFGYHSAVEFNQRLLKKMADDQLG